MGFSQGAALVGLICSLWAKGGSCSFTLVHYHWETVCVNGIFYFVLFSEIVNRNFWFSVLVSGFKSRCSLHSDIYSPTIFMPSLHIYGENDENVLPGMCASYAYNNKLAIRFLGFNIQPTSSMWSDLKQTNVWQFPLGEFEMSCEAMSLMGGAGIWLLSNEKFSRIRPSIPDLRKKNPKFKF